MPVFERASSTFSRPQFNEWLARRRSEEGLAEFTPRDGENIFKSWLRDHWKWIAELPESKGLSLFCERDVTLVVCENSQNILIDGEIHPLNVFEILPINRPKEARAMTNRLRAGYQLHDGVISDEPDIRVHVAIAEQREADHWAQIKPCMGPVAGMFMLFRKSLWNQVRFRSGTIYFDKRFCSEVQRRGARLGIAQGLYLFHLYRFGKPDPCNYTAHLRLASASSPLASERFTRISSRKPVPIR